MMVLLQVSPVLGRFSTVVSDHLSVGHVLVSNWSICAFADVPGNVEEALRTAESPLHGPENQTQNLMCVSDLLRRARSKFKACRVRPECQSMCDSVMHCFRCAQFTHPTSQVNMVSGLKSTWGHRITRDPVNSRPDQARSTDVVVVPVLSLVALSLRP